MRILRRKSVSVVDGRSRLGFSTSGGGSWPVWDRFITLDGEQLFHVGNVCGTCSFFFKQLKECGERVLGDSNIEGLNDGTLDFDRSLGTLSELLPDGDYEAVLFEVHPRLVGKDGCSDYFTTELLETWGYEDDDDFQMHREYYRGDSIVIESEQKLFEFLVPLYPTSDLNEESIQIYKQTLSDSSSPTAVSIGILDVKSSMDYPEVDGVEIAPEFPTHWCFSNYVLDGHHKLSAAAQLNASIQLLSFISIDRSWKRVPELLKYYESGANKSEK